MHRLRALLIELERLYNHATDLGALANDVGFSLANSHAQRIREQLLRINHTVTGHRLLRGAIHPGGITLLALPDPAQLQTIAADVAEQMSALVHSLDPFEPGPDGVDALRKWLAEFAELYSHYGPVIRAWTEAEADGSEFGQLGNQMLGELAVAFARHVDASPAKKLDPDVASLALLAMIERFNYYGVSGQLRLDPERTIDALAIAVHDSLFGRSARSSRRET